MKNLIIVLVLSAIAIGLSCLLVVKNNRERAALIAAGQAQSDAMGEAMLAQAVATGGRVLYTVRVTDSKRPKWSVEVPVASQAKSIRVAELMRKRYPGCEVSVDVTLLVPGSICNTGGMTVGLDGTCACTGVLTLESPLVNAE